jgi:hypothetical protein
VFLTEKNFHYTVIDADKSDGLDLVEVGTEIRWYKNNELQSSYNDKKTVDGSIIFKGDVWNVTANVSDGSDYGVLKFFVVTIGNTIPVVDSLSLTPTTAFTTSTLTANFITSDVDSDNIASYVITWYLNAGNHSQTFNLTSVDPSYILKDQQWNYTIKIFDGTNYSLLYNSSTITIQNSKPTVTGTPTFNQTENIKTITTLNISYTFNDDDSGDLNVLANLTIKWYLNGLEITSKENQTILLTSETQKNQFWSYKLRIYDGEEFSIEYSSEIIQILNSVPQIDGNLDVTPLTPLRGDDLILDYSVIDVDKLDGLDLVEVGTEIRWYKNDELQSSYNDKKTVDGSIVFKGDVWNVTVNVSDGSDYGVLKFYVVTIGNTIPVVDSVSITPSTAFTSSTLVASFSTSDVDSDQLIGFTITWFKNGINETNVFNQTDVDPIFTLKGQEWNYTIRVFDGSNTSLLYNASSITIQNTKPIIVGLPSFNQTSGITTITDINITYSYFDPDQGDDQFLLNQTNVMVSWFKQGNPVPQKDNNLTLFNFETQKEENWKFEIQIWDGEDFSIVYTSFQIDVLNTVPQIQGNLLLTPNNPKRGDNLLLDYTIIDADRNDGNDIVEIGTEIKWNRSTDGGNTWVLESIFNNQKIVDGSNIIKGDIWNITVRISDGSSFGDLKFVVITIGNTIPEITALYITDTSSKILTNAISTTTLVVGFVWTDVDFDQMSGYEITWYEDGVNSTANYNSSYVDSVYTIKGQIWNYTIRIFDGLNYSILYSSISLPIRNDLPVITDITYNISSVSTIDSANISINTFDSDNDAILIANITWFIGFPGFEIEQPQKVNDTVLRPSETQKSQVWFYTIKLYDGDGYSNIFYSPILFIDNSVPQFKGNLSVTPNNPTREFDLQLSYLWEDNDTIDGLDTNELGTIIRWYLWIGPNDTFGNWVYQDYLGTGNRTIPKSLLEKGQIWNVTVEISTDGVSFSDKKSLVIVIENSIPIVDTIELSQTELYTTDNLSTVISYSDVDADNITWFEIIWYLSTDGGNSFYENTTYYNQTSIPSSDTLKGQKWTFSIQLFDGDDYSFIYNSSVYTVLNSLPIATYVNVSVLRPLAGDDIILDWGYYDADNDTPSDVYIVWKIGGIVVLQNQTTLSGTRATNIVTVSLWLFDGSEYSIEYATEFILIVNEIQIEFVDKQYSFLLETQDIKFTTSLVDTINDELYQDAFEITVQFVQNGNIAVEFVNVRIGEELIVPASQTQPGDEWYVIVLPFDNYTHSPILSTIYYPIIVIESLPQIHNSGIQYELDEEGHFWIWTNITDVRNPETLAVNFELTFNDSAPLSRPAEQNVTNSKQWFYEFNFADKSLVKLFLNTNFTIKVTATTMEQGGISIQNSISFKELLKDKSPPRILGDPIFIFDDDENPKNVTFFVEIEEFGVGIDQVYLYYSFRSTKGVNQTSAPNSTLLGIRLKLKQLLTLMQENGDFESISMSYHNQTGDSYTYTVTVPFDFGRDTLLLFYFDISDLAGNKDPFAYGDKGTDPNRPGAVWPSPGESLEKYIPYIIAFVMIIALLSFIAIKKFSGTELVGLDIELVMENIKKVKEVDVQRTMDSHTLGIVVSFFDQRHGPIPIVQIPDILKDNFEKLVELSDLSFSACRFVENFDEEMMANFDYVVDERMRVSAIAFAFSLDRPDARGGAENITLNILTEKSVYPLVSQFTGQFTDLVHKVHVTMDKHPDAKNDILVNLKKLRKLVTMIVLSYVDLYGTTELVTEDSVE